jgi:Leucine-rich repeat (LRR) protein
MEKILNLKLIQQLKTKLYGSDEKCLFLNSNDITSIDDDALDTLIHLERLHIDLNNLTNIKSNWFKCLENLKFLDLRSNKIQSIDDDAFDRLVRLDTLHL